MELLQLKYFCALARNQHLTKTAEQLMISPPSLSAAISKLEKDLGVELFDRVGRNICLNRFGKVFYTYASHALAELENARTELRDMSREERCTIHVGLSSLPIWQTALEQFQKEYPNIIVDYFFMSPFALSDPDQSDRIDLFLGANRDILLEQYHVMDIRRQEKPVAVLSCRHILADANTINLAQLKEDTFLSMGKNNPSAHKFVLDMCNAAGFTPREVLEVDYFFRLKMLMDNRGVAITTDLGAQFVYSNPDRVRIIPIFSPIITRTQAIAWKKDRYLPRGAVIFRDFMSEYYRQEKDWQEKGSDR